MEDLKLDGISLNEKERAILNKLLNATKKTKINTKVPVNRHLKEYINRYEVSCLTCKLVYFESYYMEPDKETGALLGMLIPEDKVDTCCEVRTSLRKVTTCNSCTKRLMRLEKEEIIKLYLKEKLRWT